MVVCPLQQERDHDARDLLVEAFLDYPTWHAVAARGPASRRETIRRYYGAELAVARRWGGTILAVLERQRLLGVALVFRPEYYPPPWRSTLRFTPLLLGGAGVAIRGLRALSTMDSRHPATPHVFLHTVAAAPRNQRSGIGRALVEHVTAGADADGHPVFLLTSRTELVDYYRRFGFNRVSEANLPRGVLMWGMLREPA